MPDLRVSDHALARYAEHYPGSFEADLREAFLRATPIPAEVAQPLRGMAVRAGDTGTYHLHHLRTGMFVVDRGMVVTYLRFGRAQRLRAKAMYGGPPEPGPPEPHTHVFGHPIERMTATTRVKKNIGPVGWREHIAHYATIEEASGEHPSTGFPIVARLRVPIRGRFASFLLVRTSNERRPMRVVVDPYEGIGKFGMPCPVCGTALKSKACASVLQAHFDCEECGTQVSLNNSKGLLSALEDQ